MISPFIKKSRTYQRGKCKADVGLCLDQSLHWLGYSLSVLKGIFMKKIDKINSASQKVRDGLIQKICSLGCKGKNLSILLVFQQRKYIMEPNKELQDAINKYAITLPPRAWINESDRWENLLFSIIRQYCDDNPEKAGTVVNILRDWNLIDIEELSAADQIPLEFNSAYKKIMLGLDFTQEEIKEIAGTLVSVAVAVKENYNGKIQSLFRKYGEIIREELVSSFSDDDLDNEKITDGVSLWLQSAFGLPILSDRAYVKDYCDQRGLTKDQLTKIADDIDINLGVVDYFIEMSSR